MEIEKKARTFLAKKFERQRVNSAFGHFLSCVQKFKEGNWESSVTKAGKFVEAVVKLLWVYSGNSLPIRQRVFKAGTYAQRIIGLSPTDLPEDELRIQIPRACIFIYDVASNRGARHDSEKVNPNEMDAIVVVSVCSWILAELIRFSAKGVVDINEAKRIVGSFIERRYPIFEEIEGRVYVDNARFKSAKECSLLILYKLFPRRVDRKTLTGLVCRHGFRKTALKFERLLPYVDVDDKRKILLRANGRKKVEQILDRE